MSYLSPVDSCMHSRHRLSSALSIYSIFTSFLRVTYVTLDCTLVKFVFSCIKIALCDTLVTSRSVRHVFHVTFVFNLSTIGFRMIFKSVALSAFQFLSPVESRMLSTLPCISHLSPVYPLSQWQVWPVP